MPLHIVRNDITKINCDAIVNAANNSLLGGGGVDGAIHRAAGSQLLEECKTLGGCNTGDAKITKGYNLPARYVIHTVGPIWRGGAMGEEALLTACYNKSLQLAVQHNCETVAFPLISSGAFGYPRDKALQVAVDTITDFLQAAELTVYIVIFDKQPLQEKSRATQEIARYIDKHLRTAQPSLSCKKRRAEPLEKPSIDFDDLQDDTFSANCCILEESRVESFRASAKPRIRRQSLDEAPQSLLKMLDEIDDSFAVTLMKLIDSKSISDVECYKRANVSKQTWYKILNEKNYRPSKNTVLCFAIALRLTLEETKHLLATVGFALSQSSKFDIIITYFIQKGIYNVFAINETLFDFDQPTLGV